MENQKQQMVTIQNVSSSLEGLHSFHVQLQVLFGSKFDIGKKRREV